MVCAHGIERELVSDVSDIKHGLIREALQLTGVTEGVEVTTLADVPGSGTGLGSSSSVTVALLAALSEYQGKSYTPRELAAMACHIEIECLGKPIGKQDQFACAVGGLRRLRFTRGDVDARRLDVPDLFQEQLLLYYTGQGRQSSDILSHQQSRLAENVDALARMGEQAIRAAKILEDGTLDAFGNLLHFAWELKRTLAPEITNPTIDAMYQKARDAGALGGKICGAGGGGFLLLYVPFEHQVDVRLALREYREMPFNFEPEGVQIVYCAD
jgi:D-glycero-alpha-D-manno-heptose-7-phosphate kinase